MAFCEVQNALVFKGLFLSDAKVVKCLSNCFIDRKLRNCYKKQNELKLTWPLHVFLTYRDLRLTLGRTRKHRGTRGGCFW